MRTRILPRSRGIAAVQHHADRVHRRGHGDGRVSGERWIVGRIAASFRLVAHRALLHVDGAPHLHHRGLDQARVAGRRRLGIAFRQRLEVDRHRLGVLVRHVLQAVVDHFGHRAVHGGARGDADLQQVADLLQAPVAEPRLAVAGERGRIPVLVRDHPALEFLRLLRAAEPVDRGMAHGAVPEPLDEIRAAIPLRGLRRVGAIFAFPEVERAPSQQQLALVERKAQLVGLVLLFHRRHRLQVREDRVGILAGDLRVLRERHRGIEQRAVARDALVHGPVEVVRGPQADAGLVVGRDVGHVEVAERGGHRAAPGERLAGGLRVAGDAVARAREIFAAVDDLRARLRHGGAFGAGVGGKVAAMRHLPREARDRHADHHHDAQDGGAIHFSSFVPHAIGMRAGLGAPGEESRGGSCIDR